MSAPGRPLLRRGVELVRSGPQSYFIVDSTTGESFAIGAEEHGLVDLLSKHDSIDEVVTAFKARFGKATTARGVLDFVEELRRLDLLSEDAPTHAWPRAAPEPEPAAPAPVVPTPEEDPRRVLALNHRIDALVLLFGWILSPVMILPLLALALLAANVAVRDGERLLTQLLSHSADYHLLFYMLVFIAPKLILLSLANAVVVAMVTRRFGGTVRGFGLRSWAGVLPMFQTDLGDSMKTLSPRGRRTMMAGRITVPLAIVAAGMLGWAIARPRSTGGLLCALFIAPALLRLIIQLNPFFAGSTVHIWLSQTHRRPQLLDAARQETAAWLLSRRAPAALTWRERFWLRAYGLADLLYRVAGALLIVLGGGYFLGQQYGLGGALTVIAAFFWWITPSSPERAARG
ncbi:MAG: hypothetical protein AAF628_04575 [Planctomycetota bacterium]